MIARHYTAKPRGCDSDEPSLPPVEACTSFAPTIKAVRAGTGHRFGTSRLPAFVQAQVARRRSRAADAWHRVTKQATQRNVYRFDSAIYRGAEETAEAYPQWLTQMVSWLLDRSF